MDGEDRGPWTERGCRQIAVTVQWYELRPRVDLMLDDLEARRGGVRALTPRLRPENIVFDIEQDAFERPTKRSTDALVSSCSPVEPALTHGECEGQELPVVLGEADSISAFSPSQLSLGQAFLEDDTPLSKELNDVGSRHVVSIDATFSAAVV